MRNFLCFLLTGILLLTGGCGEDDDPTRSNDFIPLTAIAIESEHPQQFPAGTSNQFTAIGDFSGAFTSDVTGEAAFRSSNPGVLEFRAGDPPGLARGVAPGTATVTAFLGEVSGTIDFSVSDASLGAITLTPDVVSLPQGTTRQFTATGTFSDGTEQDITRDAVFTSADPAVVNIAAGGLVTAVQVGGPVTVTAEFGGMTAAAAVTVTEPAAESLVIKPAESFLVPGETFQFTATAIFTDGSQTDVTIQATWESSDTAVATVDGVGRVTAESAGEATITAAFEGQQATTALTVAAPEVITITPASQTINVGDTLDLTAEVTLADNTTRDVTGLATWTSSDTRVATVSANGQVQGIAVGAATIEASLGGETDSVIITVR